jgi:predicted RNA-binding Zn-ribbon protein involved in translation (DUF1610 family)
LNGYLVWKNGLFISVPSLFDFWDHYFFGIALYPPDGQSRAPGRRTDQRLDGRVAVTSLAEIFREYGPAYRAKYGDRILPSHQRAMADIERCRTAALGGHVYACDECGEMVYSYHSCRNRHCSQCQHQAGQQWLARQQAFLLPVPYFMVTFTLPEGLRQVAHRHQQVVYDIFFRMSAAAVQELAQDPRFVGGQIGLLGVLQTWTKDLTYHPHIHYLVPGGGLAPDGQTWQPVRRKDFLVHVKPLSILFRAKFRDALKKTDLFEQVPAEVWQQDWVVHCQPVGSGERALKYLAPYIFRVAISNSRIVNLENSQVTFRYRSARGRREQYCTLPAEEFIRRFLQHVLPRGFVKVRYYGLFSPAYRPVLNQLRLQLTPPPTEPLPAEVLAEATSPVGSPSSFPCPTCGRPMRRVQTLKPNQGRSPPLEQRVNLAAA